jgi:hypothetical protein
MLNRINIHTAAPLAGPIRFNEEDGTLSGIMQSARPKLREKEEST